MTTPNKEAAELLPCPFCGSVNINAYAYGQYAGGEPDAFCQCQDCSAIGPSGKTEAEAATAWNRRSALTAPEAAAQDHIRDAAKMVAQEAQESTHQQSLQVGAQETQDPAIKDSLTTEAQEPGERVLNIGAQLANVAFNWAQLCGHTLTSDDCALLDKLRKEWDEARRAAPAEAGGMK